MPTIFWIGAYFFLNHLNTADCKRVPDVLLDVLSALFVVHPTLSISFFLRVSMSISTVDISNFSYANKMFQILRTMMHLQIKYHLKNNEEMSI